jgi:hypothetical protein
MRKQADYGNHLVWVYGDYSPALGRLGKLLGIVLMLSVDVFKKMNNFNKKTSKMKKSLLFFCLFHSIYNICSQENVQSNTADSRG